jgi:hypothetical protein
MVWSKAFVRVAAGIVGALAAWGLLGVASAQVLSAGGPVVAPSLGQRTFGTATEVAHVINASEFQLQAGTETAAFDTTNGIHRYASAGGSLPYYYAGVRLPAGAVVSRIELDACDDSPTEEVFFAMVRSSAPGGPEPEFLTALPDHTTGAAATPGCGKFSAPLIAPETVDNVNWNYVILASIVGGFSGDARFAAVRVFYTLQVSPAPATATFGDVPPTHPFFQFVEALVASGITAGCGGGLYCPDAPLTRGQMAVFLSKALGLHFAP